MVQNASQTRQLNSGADAARRFDNFVDRASGSINSINPSESPAATDGWWRTLLELPARVLVDLPEPIALQLRVVGAPATVLLTTAAVQNVNGLARVAPNTISATAARVDNTIVFDRAELDALVLGVEADRIWHREFLGFCFEKWRTAAFHVSSSDALAGANPDPRADWSMAQVLRRLEAQVVAIECLASMADSALAHDVKAATNNTNNTNSANGVSKVNALPRLWAAA
jgi:hypothetical protein